MRRRLFLSGAAALLLSAPALANKRQGKAPSFLEEESDFGVDIAAEKGAFVKMQRPLPSAALTNTSLQVKNAAKANATRVVLDNLPPVVAQGTSSKLGSPGTCEAESFGYCLGAYTAARRPDGSQKWSAGDESKQPSTAWLYRWQKVNLPSPDKDCPKGGAAAPYAETLVAIGAPSAADVPYNPNGADDVMQICTEFDAIDVTKTWPDAANLVVGSYKGWGDIKDNRQKYLPVFKDLIRHGHAIAFSGLVPKKYGQKHPKLEKDAFMAADGFPAKGGHGQVIVGFDDAKGPAGAFLVQNSFSAEWNTGEASDPGRNGRVWYDYDAFFAGQSAALVMFPNLGGAPTGNQLGSNAPQSPKLCVKEARRFGGVGSHHVVVVLHCAEAINLRKATLAIGGENAPPMEVALDEVFRFGYVVFESPAPLKPGPYYLSLYTGDRLTGHGKIAFAYHGEITVV